MFTYQKLCLLGCLLAVCAVFYLTICLFENKPLTSNFLTEKDLPIYEVHTVLDTN